MVCTFPYMCQYNRSAAFVCGFMGWNEIQMIVRCLHHYRWECNSALSFMELFAKEDRALTMRDLSSSRRTWDIDYDFISSGSKVFSWWCVYIFLFFPCIIQHRKLIHKTNLSTKNHFPIGTAFIGNKSGLKGCVNNILVAYE